MSTHTWQDAFMSVKQVSQYLQLNEKKVYALANAGEMPATKVTGKWMFPKELIDRWMLNSSHGGLLTDRLIISGSDDPLLFRLVSRFAQETHAQALVAYSPSGTRLGLDLLQAHRIDVCGIHWGPHNESYSRHPALLRHYPQHKNWVLIRAFEREQGLLVNKKTLQQASSLQDLVDQRFRWALRQSGAGAQRFLMENLASIGINLSSLSSEITALSEREAAATVCMNLADVAPGARAIATEFGLGFVSLGWESFDFALPQGIWFRRLFQDFIQQLKSETSQQMAIELTGYEFNGTGELVWGDS